VNHAARKDNFSAAIGVWGRTTVLTDLLIPVQEIVYGTLYIGIDVVTLGFFFSYFVGPKKKKTLKFRLNRVSSDFMSVTDCVRHF
jgi:vacuolar-type H+-ATPase subunit I/STV1